MKRLFSFLAVALLFVFAYSEAPALEPVPDEAVVEAPVDLQPTAYPLAAIDAAPDITAAVEVGNYNKFIFSQAFNPVANSPGSYAVKNTYEDINKLVYHKLGNRAAGYYYPKIE